MRLPKKVVRELAVEPGGAAGLHHRSTSHTRADWLSPTGRSTPRDLAEHDLESFKQDLASAQELLYASDRWALLLVFQALDAAGKDGTIKHVMSGVNPQGCQVFSFGRPSDAELRHDFLWRCATVLPERGRIGIFNRSYYEEVLVVRVHPELLAAQHLPDGAPAGPRLWNERYEDINAFERHLVRNGTRIVKFFLHVSEDEQRARFLARLDDPGKQWKFSPADLAERAHFAEYLQAYEDAITATSTPWAPWYVVPADHKPAMRALVGGIVVDAIDQLGLHLPAAGPDRAAELEAARRALGGASGAR
ncbi:MAG: polyphosphate kinase 2 family protein [Actinomycetota bacterium]|nr:polyphosphate kinase 2 family protein [Actinomycetota bacterium]